MGIKTFIKMLEGAGYIRVETCRTINDAKCLAQFQYAICQGLSCELVILGPGIMGSKKAAAAFVFDNETDNYLHHTMLDFT